MVDILHGTRRPSIRLASGGYWYFDEPETSTWEVSDIAHNLSKEARFNGSNDGDLAYSVAQHGVNASYIVPIQFAFEALNHDNAEAFYKDLTTWLKGLCPDYKRELKRGEEAVARRLGLPLEMSPEVKLADYQMLKLEKLALFKDSEHTDGFYHIEGVDITNLEHLVDLKPWSARYAKMRWLDRYEELKP
jgi:5'-deoxynucleotidase YfbR-like HD superfamily hydrolase